MYKRRSTDLEWQREKIPLKEGVFQTSNTQQKIIESNILVLDSKTQLQEYSLKNYKKLPVYSFLGSKGPRHNPTFKVAVSIYGSKKFFGLGSSKQQAELNAAKNLLKHINVI